MNVAGTPIPSRTHTHPSHTQKISLIKLISHFLRLWGERIWARWRHSTSSVRFLWILLSPSRWQCNPLSLLVHILTQSWPTTLGVQYPFDDEVKNDVHGVFTPEMINLPQATWITTFVEGVTDKSTGLPLFSEIAWLWYKVSGVMCSVSVWVSLCQSFRTVVRTEFIDTTIKQFSYWSRNSMNNESLGDPFHRLWPLVGGWDWKLTVVMSQVRDKDFNLIGGWWILIHNRWIGGRGYLLRKERGVNRWIDVCQCPGLNLWQFYSLFIMNR